MKRRIFILLACILSVAMVATAAWMDDGTVPVGGSVLFGYGGNGHTAKYTIGIESTDLLTEFYVMNGNGVYELIYEGGIGDKSEKPYLNFDDIQPSDAIMFKFVFKNLGTSNIRATIAFSGITSRTIAETGVPKLSEAMYMSLTESEGYPDYSIHRPIGTFDKMSDVLVENTDKNGNRSWSATFASGIFVPPTAEPDSNGIYPENNSPITIYGYILFDRNSTNEYEGLDLDIGSILILS